MDPILSRRSVRKFDLDKKIPYDDLVELCKVAESAPTARKQKSRRYVIIENKELILELSKIYTKSTMRVEECNQMIAIIGINPDNLPCPDFEVIDLSCAAENIMIKATEKEIGSVILGTYPSKDRYIPANKLLDIQNGDFVFAFICLGYPIDKDSFYDSNKFDISLVTHIKE